MGQEEPLLMLAEPLTNKLPWQLVNRFMEQGIALQEVVGVLLIIITGM